MNYVPYDTGALTGFATHIKSVIGVTVNKGIIIMAIIMAVLIVMSIIKKFTK